MHFLLDIQRRSFVHRMAQARGRRELKLGGLGFNWDGTRRCYSASLQTDIPVALLKHPAIEVHVMSNPPSIVPTEKEMFAPLEPEPEAPRRKLGRPPKAPQPPETGG